MKIAVFHNLPSGGAKRALYDHVNYLTKLGHKVDVFVPSTANESYLPLKDIANNLNIFPVKKTISGLVYSFIKYTPQLNISLKDLENTEKEIAEIINKGDYDIVFSEQDQYTSAPFFLKYIKKPTVCYFQQPPRIEAILNTISLNKNHNFIKKIISNYTINKYSQIDKENASFAKYILVNSYFSRESILRTYGVNPHVSYLGIDTIIFKPIEVEKENFVLSVGTCTPSKGYDFIIRSLSLIDTNLRPKLVIVSNSGDEDWEIYLKKIANDHNVELEILKLIDDEKLALLYNKAKLVVYAPYLEPFGLVPIESMACGTPVVGIKEGGVRETVLHNETGMLIDRNEVLFGEAITELLSNDNKRNNMGEKAVKNVENFWTVEHAGERLLWHLNQAINPKSISYTK